MRLDSFPRAPREGVRREARTVSERRRARREACGAARARDRAGEKIRAA